MRFWEAYVGDEHCADQTDVAVVTDLSEVTGVAAVVEFHEIPHHEALNQLIL